MLDWLFTPLSYTFMQRGLLAAILVGIVCSVIGSYIVLRSLAYLGDALAHSVLPGVAIAYLVNGNLTIGALIAAILVALGIGFFTRDGEIKEDTAIGILFSAALSIGIAIISSVRTSAVDLSHILFGNLLGVSKSDLWGIGIIGFIVLLTTFIMYKPLLVVTFDPVLATTLHLNVGLYKVLLLVILSLTIVLSIQTVGVALVSAMLVTPAATAYLVTRRLPTMMAISALIGILSSFIGLFASYYLNIASGAAIVLVATILFICTYLFSPRRGLIIGWIRKR